jgi:predicted RNA-binding protein
MSVLTRDCRLAKITISEPQIIVPYELESQYSKYDVYPRHITNDQKNFIIDNLHQFLSKLKEKSRRERIYYCGSKFHYQILNAANNNLFNLIFIIPPLGIRDYAKSATELKRIIEKNEFLKDNF